MERRIKGKGRPDIKRGILPGPQRRQPAGAEGTPERGCPSGGGRGRTSQGRASAPPMTCLVLGLGHHPIRRVWSEWSSGLGCRACGFLEGGFGKARVSHLGSRLSTCSLGDAAGPTRAAGLNFLLRGIGVEQTALNRDNSCIHSHPSQHAHACTESFNRESKRILFTLL